MSDLKRDMEALLQDLKRLHTKIDVALKGGNC